MVMHWPVEPRVSCLAAACLVLSGCTNGAQEAKTADGHASDQPIDAAGWTIMLASPGYAVFNITIDPAKAYGLGFAVLYGILDAQTPAWLVVMQRDGQILSAHATSAARTTWRATGVEESTTEAEMRVFALDLGYMHNIRKDLFVIVGAEGPTTVSFAQDTINGTTPTEWIAAGRVADLGDLVGVNASLEGQHASFAHFFDATSSDLDGLSRQRMSAGHVSIREPVAPELQTSLRPPSLQVEAKADADGFGSTAIYAYSGFSETKFDVSVETMGATYQDVGIVSNTNGLDWLATGMVTGLPLGYSHGDGAGAVAARITIEEAAAVGFTRLITISLDQPLGPLVYGGMTPTAYGLAGLV